MNKYVGLAKYANNLTCNKLCKITIYKLNYTYKAPISLVCRNILALNIFKSNPLSLQFHTKNNLNPMLCFDVKEG